jgi:uncharacterized protein DUF6883
VLLPHADEAVIAREKLEGYLLSTSHPIGRFKARFFAGLGFSAAHWRELEAAFRRDHLTQDATPVETLAPGQSYTIRAILKGPTGESAVVVSVWFVRHGESVPRFVTAYPGGSS